MIFSKYVSNKFMFILVIDSLGPPPFSSSGRGGHIGGRNRDDDGNVVDDDGNVDNDCDVDVGNVGDDVGNDGNDDDESDSSDGSDSIIVVMINLHPPSALEGVVVLLLEE